MEKNYRLEFISKKASALRTEWQSLIESGALTNTLGVLAGVFKAHSPQLTSVIERYRNDKEKFDIQMEASCTVIYDEDDFNTNEFFKLYPPNISVVYNQQGEMMTCGDCGRGIGQEGMAGQLAFDNDTSLPNAVIGAARSGELLLHLSLVSEIERRDGAGLFKASEVEQSKGKADWLQLIEAPSAKRINTRNGYCPSCGNALKSDSLPEPDESYLSESASDFLLSPDAPALPVLSRSLAQWVMQYSDDISLVHFKPVQVENGSVETESRAF